MAAVIPEADIQGVFTHLLDDVVKAMAVSGISQSPLSRFCKEIDGRGKAVLDRPIEGDCPDLWIDGLPPVLWTPGSGVS